MVPRMVHLRRPRLAVTLVLSDSRTQPYARRGGEAAVAGRLNREPRLAACITRAAPDGGCTARHGAVQLAAVVRYDALAAGDAPTRGLGALRVSCALTGRSPCCSCT